VTERTAGERFEELVLLSGLEKHGYCFFPDAEAAADAVAVSFLYSALASLRIEISGSASFQVVKKSS